MTTLRELARRTPDHRDRHVDLLRAVAIALVVLGHWLVMVVAYDAGSLTGYSALGELTWAHPLTWLFQVMPVFFIVGGFANAASLTSRRRRGGTAAGWLLDRSGRLVRPTTVLLAAIAGAAVLARLAGVDPAMIGTAAWLASIPLWFLIAYLGMVVLTPVMLRLHHRAGLAVPVLLLVPVLVGDAARIGTGQEAWAAGNFLLAWLAIHQIGFSWYDGRLPGRPRVAAGLLLGGLVTLVALTHVGPYPVSMVTVPGAELQNPSPPTLALVALAAAQLGLALLLRGPSNRWLRHTGPWAVVIAVNAVILSVFLWHMTAAVIGTVGLHLAGALPGPPVDSTDWLWWQLPWVLLLAVVLAGLVALVGPVERRGDRPARTAGRRPAAVAAALRRPRAQLTLALGGYLAALLGLWWQAFVGEGYYGWLGLPTGALLLYAVGAAALRLGRWSATVEVEDQVHH